MAVKKSLINFINYFLRRPGILLVILIIGLGLFIFRNPIFYFIKIIIFSFTFLVFIIGYGEFHDVTNYEPRQFLDDPLVGTNFSFDEPRFYYECIGRDGQPTSVRTIAVRGRWSDINRAIDTRKGCNLNFSSVLLLETKQNLEIIDDYIPLRSEFLILTVIRSKEVNFEADYSIDYLVMQGPDDLLYTYNRECNPNLSCDNDLPGHIDRLLIYAENNDKVRVLLPSYRYLSQNNTHTPSRLIFDNISQENLVNYLTNLSVGFKVENIEKIENPYFSNFPSVAFDTNLRTLIFLVKHHPAAHYMLMGLDEEYLRVLTSTDVSNYMSLLEMARSQQSIHIFQ